MPQFVRLMPHCMSVPPVECVATDLKEGYRRIVKKWKEDIKISADPFHVVRLATRVADNERLFQQAEERLTIRDACIPAGPIRAGGERLRSKTRKLQNEILQKYPNIACAYALKEQVRAVYLADTETEQRLLFEECEKMLERALNDPALFPMHAELKTFQRTLCKWRKPITTYFSTHLSTAMVEGFHTVIKLLKRISFGFRDVMHYRTKILLGLGCDFTITIRRV